MSSGKSQIQRLLDVLVYAPAGLAQSAVEEFESLAEKGRHRVEGQVHTARLVGQFAVQTARHQAEQAFGAAVAKFSGDAAGRQDTSTDLVEEVGTSSGPESTERETSRASIPAPSLLTTNGSEPAGDLAIPGYDSLSASQVVQRLGGLSHEELEEVKYHELAHRHRRTILNRVDQLLSGAGTEQHP
jgi:hypothetical protein